MTSADLKRRSLLGAAGLLMAAPRASLAAPARPRVIMETAQGVIVVELEAGKAPITSANFLRYVDAKAYDGATFFRAARDPGIPQGGTIVAAPSPKIHPFPPIRHESTAKTGLRHVTGTISLGRFATGTATSNFFICASDEPYLDAHPGQPGDNQGYAAFGQVVRGMSVVRKILALPTNGKSEFADQRGQWLTRPVVISSMRRAPG